VKVYTSYTNFFALTADEALNGWDPGDAGLLGNSDGRTLQDILRAPAIAQPTPITG
jgi:hypothetical protein